MARRAIEAALAALRRAHRAAAERRGAAPGAGSPVRLTARAALEERLRSLEEGLAEVKSRIDGLLFLVVGVVLSELLARLVA